MDDFAFLKRSRYGTILYDLEAHRTVDLLPERTSEALKHWLKEHPGVLIIGRDRAGVYAEGGRNGAPEAQQVADRWHLLKNLGVALERLFFNRPALLSRSDAGAAQMDTAEAPAAAPTGQGIPPEPVSASVIQSPERLEPLPSTPLLERTNGTAADQAPAVGPEIPHEQPKSSAEEQRWAHRSCRLARYEQARELYRRGYTPGRDR